jgi:hypothetical protein
MNRSLALGLAVLAAGCHGRPDSPPPAPVEAETPREPALAFDGVVFDGTAHGRLIPALGDVDGDGRTDLLVGAGHDAGTCGGRLLVFRNRGTDARPDYATPEWFHAAVPTGQIPES